MSQLKEPDLEVVVIVVILSYMIALYGVFLQFWLRTETQRQATETRSTLLYYFGQGSVSDLSCKRRFNAS